MRPNKNKQKNQSKNKSHGALIPITTTHELVQFLEKNNHATYATIDTEFLREKTYWPKLCLIQIAFEDDAAIIDPLAEGIDLTSLFALLQNKKIVKVFHAARQDLEIFYQLTNGQIPSPLFDTQVAAMVCGFGEQIGYAKLVQHFLNITIDKRFQFTDWARRPLSAKQLDYALSDVTHLRVIYKELNAQLEANGRTPWLAEEMGLLCAKETYQSNPENAWMRIKKKFRNKKQIAIAMMLCAWREKTAQQRNVPRNRVLKDDAIFEMTLHPPQAQQDFQKLRSGGAKQLNAKEREQILKAVKTALAMDLEQIAPIKTKRPMSEREMAVAELLRIFLKSVAAKEKVASKLIATTSQLDHLAMSDDPDHPLLQGWRGEIFGKEAMGLKSGKHGLKIENGQVISFKI